MTTTPAKRAADAADLGRPSARKSGRNPSYPYVPIIIKSDGHTEQVMGLAYQTRTDAVIAAERSIAYARRLLAAKLAEPRHRALREWYGLPREISAPTEPRHFVATDHLARPEPGTIPARWPADRGRVDGRCALCGEPIHAVDITADWTHSR